MTTDDTQEQAIELLQQLGLKEYEASCFVGLSRVQQATAKEISDITEVPRTRVYDAIRVLDARGLVEIQHSSPQRFRAVSMDEAVETLRDRFESRIDRLRESLRQVEPADTDVETTAQEVWALEGNDAIANRTQKLIGEATQEVVLVVGEPELLSADLIDSLNARAHEIPVIVGTVSEDLQARIQDAVPEAEVFVSGLEWLRATEADADGTAIGRLLLVDRETLLLSSYKPDSGLERAVFGRGFGNGLVVIVRRLMETGLLPPAESG